MVLFNQFIDINCIPAVLSGGLIGLLLALTGSGGSILGVPLLIYYVGVTDIHLALGTSAIVVSLSAFINLLINATKGYVKWEEGLSTGIICFTGAIIGSSIGKHIPSNYILIPFAFTLVVIAFLMIKPKNLKNDGFNDKHRAKNKINTLSYSFLAGCASGFFGIGGGFLIIPLLVWKYSMRQINATATSLLIIVIMGSATSINYSLSKDIDWTITLIMIAGAAIGGGFGFLISERLKERENILRGIFSFMLICTAGYMLHGLI